VSRADEWREVQAPLCDVLAEVLLRGQRGDVVTIVEGDDPDDPDRTWVVLVPPWGEA